MVKWLINLAGAGIFKMFGDAIVQPILQGYLKSKDVDLEKFKTSQTSTTQLATAVLQGNIEFAKVKSTYVLAVLQWWPFRAVLFLTLLVAATRFSLIMIDSTWPFVWGCIIDGKRLYGDACSWDIPPIKGTYGQAELQYILFFVIAKPVDTVISGALGLVSKYLNKG